MDKRAKVAEAARQIAKHFDYLAHIVSPGANNFAETMMAWRKKFRKGDVPDHRAQAIFSKRANLAGRIIQDMTARGELITLAALSAEIVKEAGIEATLAADAQAIEQTFPEKMRAEKRPALKSRPARSSSQNLATRRFCACQKKSKRNRRKSGRIASKSSASASAFGFDVLEIRPARRNQNHPHRWARARPARRGAAHFRRRALDRPTAKPAPDPRRPANQAEAGGEPMKPSRNPAYPASDAASADDREWFVQRPWRRFRARPFRDDELCQGITMFQADEADEFQEVNLVIVMQIYPGWRARMPMYAPQVLLLDSDERIERYLRSRGIDPDAPIKIPGEEGAGL